MIAATLLCLLFVSSFAKSTVVYEDRAFVAHFGEEQLINPQTQERDLIIHFDTEQCLSSVLVKTENDASVRVQKISGRDREEDTYLWKDITSGIAGHSMDVNENFCLSHLRILSSSTIKFVSIDTEDEATSLKKRQITEAAVACSEADEMTYPVACENSSPLCVPASETGLGDNRGSRCGCEIDADCFAALRPFCQRRETTAGVKATFGRCVGCGGQQEITTPGNADRADHLYCRVRYPSIYAYRKLGDGEDPYVNLDNVEVPIASQEKLPLLVKEVCFKSDGSCQRCDQAKPSETDPFLTGVTWPTFQTTIFNDSPSFALSQSLTGNFFCSNLYDLTVNGFHALHFGLGADSRTFEARPVCSSVALFVEARLCGGESLREADCAIDDTSNIYKNGRVSLNVNEPNTPPVNDQSGTAENFENVDGLAASPQTYIGACMPCSIRPDDNPASPSIFYHTLCSMTDANAPICTGGCSKCTSNEDCFPSANDGTDDALLGCHGPAGTKSRCTGGTNCQADGSCKFCTSDSDCKSGNVFLDGPGANGNQEMCETSTGRCKAAFKCDIDDNGAAVDSEAGNDRCGTQDGNSNNCNVGGSCIRCTSNAQCGSTDLGGHDVCDIDTGICKVCVQNSDCGLDNCMKSGKCVACVNAASCGDLDGGLTPNQPVCLNRICIDSCNDKTNANEYCAATYGAGKPNCNKDGTCEDCNVAPLCTSDGGDSPDQPLCGTDKECVFPFQCVSNKGAGVAETACSDARGGDNCQESNACLDCAITRSSTNDDITTTCSSKDGGLVALQPNCRSTPGDHVCINACSTNADCSNTQGLNCMATGLCLNCRNDDDCGLTSKPWNGDKGSQPLCENSICVDACTDATCSSTTNCMENGRCVRCESDDDCTSTSNVWKGDGPPGQGSNTKCSNGKCVDPYCYHNSDCVGAGRNCAKNGECFDCRATGAGQTFAGYSCGEGVGLKGDGPDFITPLGIANSVGIPNQPNCDAETGICVNFCTTDAECEARDPCEPFCQTDRGCCVECVEDNNCPYLGSKDTYKGTQHEDGVHLQWRNGQALADTCDTHFHQCRPSRTCEVDSDCSGSTPACEANLEMCVACTSDAHCPDTAPACSSGNKCIACTTHDHCGAGKYCVGGSCYDCILDSHCTNQVCRGLQCVDESSPSPSPGGGSSSGSGTSVAASLLVLVVAITFSM